MKRSFRRLSMFSSTYLSHIASSSSGKVNRGSYDFLCVQGLKFGSKKEKSDKETKKFRNLLKISGVRNNEREDNDNRKGKENVKRIINENNKVDYKSYDIKIEEIIKNFDIKIKKLLENTLTVDFFNNIVVTKDKKKYKLSDLSQVVIKSSKTIYFYPYIISDIQKIIHTLKVKDNTWNPTTPNDGQYILLQIPPLTNEVKLKKKKEAKDLLEKVKNDIRNIRHKIRDFIGKNIEGDEWKIEERNKLDNYIKNKVKNIENVYEKYTKNY
ncbi:ribosome-recycling factor, putative [Plasmodium vinckei vinckei]|uniref:Ribosome recycling factor n=1 Tax=Plasmodium vinckei vinckei TaxID=54757 RepID=A0A081ICF1_PLAVN|nr:ribosome-recycling factor, putative [Plasmodium vinckei vinckei]KEG01359.1 ribosome recycling factor [Plasmodium vinckei vinckei]VEV55337.1 ribosome-recycling factor, putative [Plasmodium vinckei vinckei]